MAPVFDEQPSKRPEFQKTDNSATRDSLFAAPARESAAAAAAPTFAALDGGRGADSESTGSSKKPIVFVVLFLALAAAGYFAYTKFVANKSGAPAVAPQAQPASPESLPVSANPAGTTPSMTVTAQPPAAIARTESEAPSHTAASKQSDAEPEPEVVVTHPAPQKVLVKTGSAQQKQAESTVSEVSAPPVLGSGESTPSTAISGIVQSTPTALPKVAAETLRISQGVTDGLLIKKVPPTYPRQAIQMRVQGAVQLQAMIDKQGRITAVQVVKGDALLARAAVDAVKQWRYKPYFLDGQPVDIQTQITVNFKLP